MTSEDVAFPNKLRFQLPSYEVIELDISSTIKSYDFTVKDLKHMLFEHGFRVNWDRIRLVQSHQELSDDIQLKKSGFCTENLIEVILKVTYSEYLRHFFRYDEFIKKITPSDGDSDVHILCQVSIVFRPNIQNHMIFIPALLSTSADIVSFYPADMMKNFNGNKVVAARHGYKEWSSGSMVPKERLLLLEVDESLDLRLGSIRYDVDSALNYDYDSGDNNSWQRYTTHLPVECRLDVTVDEENKDFMFVTMTPFTALKCDTHYAVLLCNNVPTIPCALQDCELEAFLPCGLGEDRLFMFKTEDGLGAGHKR